MHDLTGQRYNDSPAASLLEWALWTADVIGQAAAILAEKDRVGATRSNLRRQAMFLAQGSVEDSWSPSGTGAGSLPLAGLSSVDE